MTSCSFTLFKVKSIISFFKYFIRSKFSLFHSTIFKFFFISLFISIFWVFIIKIVFLNVVWICLYLILSLHSGYLWISKSINILCFDLRDISAIARKIKPHVFIGNRLKLMNWIIDIFGIKSGVSKCRIIRSSFYLRIFHKTRGWWSSLFHLLGSVSILWIVVVRSEELFATMSIELWWFWTRWDLRFLWINRFVHFIIITFLNFKF